MKHLRVYLKEDIHPLIAKRKGETKFGECVQVLNTAKNISENIKKSTAKYVLLGVPEDIGIKMNNGKGGAFTAWLPTLKALCNIQENQFNKGENLLILGYLDFLDEVNNFSIKSPNFKEKGNALVQLIDEELSALIQLIISSKKIPIIIGGGHNNAYGNIKGSFQAIENQINVINFDAHTDFRNLEERHSGNGFSYAFNNGFLNHYYMFGIHENYTSKSIFETIYSNQKLQYTTFEALEIKKTKDFFTEMKNACSFISKNYFGIEIDLDAVEYFPSSAMTPSGFSTKQTRQFVNYFGKQKNALYLHICEASPSILNESSTELQVGKFISYLISDFIKARKK